MMTLLPMLSICIPTFQREANVVALVVDLLRCQRDDFEVIVIDNLSTDNTMARLSRITDSRLHVLKNTVNIGGWLNVVHSISYGSGRIKLFMTDKDHCRYEMLGQFIEFLKTHPTVSCGYCEFSDEPKRTNRVFAAGIESTRAVGYSWRHPTGYFFNAELLNQSGYIDEYRDSQKIGQFPFDILLAEFASQSSAAIYANGLFTREDPLSAANVKSYITTGSSSDAFFRPENRLKVALNFAEHLDSLKLSSLGKRQIEASIFLHGLTSSTNGFRLLLANQHLCSHYRIESRSVGVKELLLIGWAYTNGYFKHRDSCIISKGLRIFCIAVFVLPELMKKLRRRL